MRPNEIISGTALALLLGFQLLANALPALDYIWTKEERIYTGIDGCDPETEDCTWPELLGQGSYKDSDSGPAVRIAAAGVHPHQNDVAPGSAAETTTVTVTEIPVTKAVAPCTQRGPHHSIVTHGVPVFGFELHRRGEDSDDIPSYLKPGELGTPYPASIMGASVGPTSPTAYPCDSGPCPMGFVRYLWADLCMCVWNPSMKTTSSTIR